MREYRVDLGRILEFTGGDLTLDEDVVLDDIVIGAERFRPAGPAHVAVTVTNTGAGVVVMGTVTTEMRTECSRCLEPFATTFTGQVEGFYVSPSHAVGLPEEQPSEPIVDRHIDLMPALVAALALEAPFAPLHDEACKGICATCGCNLNAETCECADAPTASPFGALKGLLEQEDDS